MNNVVWTGSVSELINVPCRLSWHAMIERERERERESMRTSEILERDRCMHSAMGQMESYFLSSAVTHLKVLDTAQVSKCPSAQLSKCPTVQVCSTI